MFGSKRKKRDRLATIGDLVRESRDGLTQAELARELGVDRSTINKDLAVIQERSGILLAEDDDGRIFWVSRR